MNQPSMQDVARRPNVSLKAVSRVINSEASMHQDPRDGTLEVASKFRDRGAHVRVEGKISGVGALPLALGPICAPLVAAYSCYSAQPHLHKVTETM